jgi:hypothetical protein
MNCFHYALKVLEFLNQCKSFTTNFEDIRTFLLERAKEIVKKSDDNIVYCILNIFDLLLTQVGSPCCKTLLIQFFQSSKCPNKKCQYNDVKIKWTAYIYVNHTSIMGALQDWRFINQVKKCQKCHQTRYVDSIKMLAPNPKFLMFKLDSVLDTDTHIDKYTYIETLIHFGEDIFSLAVVAYSNSKRFFLKMATCNSKQFLYFYG